VSGIEPELSASRDEERVEKGGKRKRERERERERGRGGEGERRNRGRMPGVRRRIRTQETRLEERSRRDAARINDRR